MKKINYEINYENYEKLIMKKIIKNYESSVVMHKMYCDIKQYE